MQFPKGQDQCHQSVVRAGKQHAKGTKRDGTKARRYKGSRPFLQGVWPGEMLVHFSSCGVWGRFWVLGGVELEVVLAFLRSLANFNFFLLFARSCFCWHFLDSDRCSCFLLRLPVFCSLLLAGHLYLTMQNRWAAVTFGHSLWLGQFESLVGASCQLFEATFGAICHFEAIFSHNV